MTNESVALSIALRGTALLINSILPISTVVFLLSLAECAIFYAYKWLTVCEDSIMPSGHMTPCACWVYINLSVRSSRILLLSVLAFIYLFILVDILMLSFCYFLIC